MHAAGRAASVGRVWFSILVLGSAILVFVTFLSFALDGRGALSTLLYWIGLAGENNVGAWWSGMLLLLAAAFALDGAAARNMRRAERSAWLALAAALLILSFDEVASLHEFLVTAGLEYIAVLAVPLAPLIGYAWLELLRSGQRRVSLLLLLAFVLLGTVPLQEYIQHSREWPNPVVYGLRAAIEEGIELLAMLLLVAVTSRNTLGAIADGREPFEFARHRLLVLGVAATLAPILVAATFVLPYPGGPADWLAAACYLGCALIVVRRIAAGHDGATAPVIALGLWYLAASLGSNAIRLEWDPVILGTPVGVRGLFVALLLASAVPVLRRAGRRANPMLYAGAAGVAVVGSLWPHVQLLWCGLPVLIALHIYAGESALAVDVPLASASGGMAVAGPAEG